MNWRSFQLRIADPVGIADRGLRIADFKPSKPRFAIAQTDGTTDCGLPNPQSAIRNPQSE
jgi:hypothetical protein